MLRHSAFRASSVPAHLATLISAIALFSAGAADINSAQADDLIVRYDQAQLLRMPKPVAEIIVGNPSIADVTIQGANMLVVTGKTFGVTNVIALDSDRNIIQDQRVIVERDQSLVNLHRGNLRQTYSCTPQCQPNFTIGDDQGYFNIIGSQNTAKTRFSADGSADTGSGGQ